MSMESVDGGGDMVATVTPAVMDEAISLLEGESMDTSMAGLRLLIQQDGYTGLSCGVHFDNKPEDNDTVVERHGLYMFVDPTSINYIDGSTLDFEGGLRGAGFCVNSPSAESSCDYDESFRM